MKIDTSSVKRGTVLDIDGSLYKVIETAHTHMGRGGATYNFKVKNIITGNNNTFTYKSGTMLEQAMVETNNAIFLYANGDTYSFMEQDNGEMFDVHESVLENEIKYLKENLDCFLLKHNGNVIGIVLPTTISYTIKETVPGVKGDRSQAGKKPATLDNGMEVQVPLHKEIWQTVSVNTLTGDAN